MTIFARETTNFKVNELTATCFGSIFNPITKKGTKSTPPERPKLPARTPTMAPKIGRLQVGAMPLNGIKCLKFIRAITKITITP